MTGFAVQSLSLWSCIGTVKTTSAEIRRDEAGTPALCRDVLHLLVARFQRRPVHPRATTEMSRVCFCWNSYPQMTSSFVGFVKSKLERFKRRGTCRTWIIMAGQVPENNSVMMLLNVQAN